MTLGCDYLLYTTTSLLLLLDAEGLKPPSRPHHITGRENLPCEQNKKKSF